MAESFSFTCDASWESTKKVQVTLDKLQLYNQQKSAKMVDSKPKVVVYTDEIQNFTDKSQVEIQESEVKTTNEDINGDEVDVTSDDQFDELVEFTYEYYFATPDLILDNQVLAV